MDSTPIATADQYKRALLAMRDKSLPRPYLAMLQAQCRAVGHMITATKLAEAAEYENFNAANRHYGEIGKQVAGHLHYMPAKRADGTPRWWTTLSYALDGNEESDTGHFQFVMRPEMVAALKDMRWA